MIGSPLEWDDLARRGAGDLDAVRELTARIDDALRELTINLETREDASIVECAEAIHGGEYAPEERDPAGRLKRTRQITEVLAAARRDDPERLQPLVHSVAEFARILTTLGLEPIDLDRPLSRSVVGLNLRTIGLLLTVPLALVGTVVYRLPYQLTKWMAENSSAPHDVQGTTKLFGGGLVFLLWMALLAGIVGWQVGWWPAVAAMVLQPPLALLTQSMWDRWMDFRVASRRRLVLGTRRTLGARLLARRRELAAEIEAFRLDHEKGRA